MNGRMLRVPFSDPEWILVDDRYADVLVLKGDDGCCRSACNLSEKALGVSEAPETYRHNPPLQNISSLLQTPAGPRRILARARANRPDSDSEASRDWLTEMRDQGRELDYRMLHSPPRILRWKVLWKESEPCSNTKDPSTVWREAIEALL
jgi:hypothetical protein